MSKKDKPLIFVYGDSPTSHTGFGTVNREVWTRLKHKYRLVFLGINFTGDPLPGYRDFVIYPCNGDARGRDKFGNLLTEYKPDALFVLNDYDACEFIPNDLIRARQITKKDIPWILWSPVDGEPFYQNDVELIKRYVDNFLVVSDYGKKVVEESGSGLKPEVIKHGVDTSLFKKYDPDQPLSPNGFTVNSERERLGTNDKFVILMVGKNQVRKQYALALEAFAEFAKDKEDAILYIHAERNSFWGWNLNEISHYLSKQNEKKGYLPFEKRIYFTQGIVGPLGLPIQDMVLLYNMSDCYLQPSSGEGWGLGAAEAMACELPIIVGDNTSQPEVAGDDGAAIKIKTQYRVFNAIGDRSLYRFIPSKKEIVKALDKLYQDPNLRKEMGRLGRKRVVSQPEFNWDNIANQIDEQIQKTLEKRKVLDLSNQEIL